MRKITQKGEIVAELRPCIEAYQNGNLDQCLSVFHERILLNKVKFPLLEYCAATLYELLSEEEQLPFCDEIAKRQTEGGNVILGIILQKRLPNNFMQSFQKATEYILINHLH